MIHYDTFTISNANLAKFTENLGIALTEHTTDKIPTNPKDYRILKLEILKTGKIDVFGNYEDYTAIVIIASTFKTIT